MVKLLEKHNSLGYLKEYNFNERVNEFKKRAGRQLLVALHEVTLGKPFEEILVDEYNAISPHKAKAIYLTICVLNRLNVPVRAGLISRMYGITFPEFKEKLFAPLEHVVINFMNPKSGYYYYKARHPEIAKIVFEQILNDRNGRFNEYIKILKNLNISYSSDHKSYRSLIQARVLNEIFPDYQDANQIFEAANEMINNDPYLYHQRGIYEMLRPDPSFNASENLLETALSLSRNNETIIHSLSELYLSQTEADIPELKKKHYRKKSRKLANSLINNKSCRKYAYHTLIKISMGELKELLEKESEDIEIDKSVEQIESHLEKCLQEYPGESYFNTLESKFYELLKKEERAIKALEKAFENNPRNKYIAIRLAKFYKEQDNVNKAIDIIKKAIESNRGDQQLNYRLAMLLKETKEVTNENLLYYLRRSFTPGDGKLEAQFWYARYCFVSDNDEKIQESKEIFKQLQEKDFIPYKKSMEIKSVIKEPEQPHYFEGILEKKLNTFGFIRRDGRGDEIFIHSSNINPRLWAKISRGSRIKFAIGFNYKGPLAVEIELL